MHSDRISMREQELRTPRGQLDRLWWDIKVLMPTSAQNRMLDNEENDWHEAVEELKRWADDQHGDTGVYPEDEVRKFLANFS